MSLGYLTVGCRVLVHIPADDREAHAPIVKFHDKELTVVNRVTLGHLRTRYVYYELSDAKSEHWNIPYAFIREWLIPIGGNDEQMD